MRISDWSSDVCSSDLRAIVEHAAANAPEAGSIEAKIGDLWATGMDEAAINAAGITPIQPLLAQVDAISDSASLADYLRKSYADGNGMLFNFGPQADFKNYDKNTAYANQGGLGRPDRGDRKSVGWGKRGAGRG